MNYLQRWFVTHKLKANFYGMSREELEKHQSRALEKLWRYVQTCSPYYQEHYPVPMPFSNVAASNKASVMAHFNEIITENLDRDELVRFRISKEKTGKMDYYPGGYSIGLSSGTSGNRLLTVLSKRERDLYSCLLWARNGIPASIKKYRVLFALRTYNPTFTEIGAFGVKMVYVDYTHPIEKLIQLINEKQLNILAGPPSLLLMISRQANQIDHPIDTLVSYAEVLDDSTKATLSDAFHAPVVQIYQGAEGFVASTCKDGHLHLNEDVLYVEPLGDPEAGPVSVLLTDLYRRTQPVIRYHLDDLLELDSTPCTCGSAFRRITKIHGRSDDLFVLLNADGQPRYFFPDYVRRAINQASDEILEYQAIQHAHDHIEIRLILQNGADRSQIEADILQNLAWRAEKIGVPLTGVRFTDAPPERNERSKKMIRVIRKFPWKY